MTLPMSFADDAPVEAMAASTAAFELGGVDRRRKIALENHNLGRLFVGQVLPAVL